MKVLNTYTDVATGADYWLVVIVMLVLILGSFLFREDITRAVELRFNGFIYNHANKVWLLGVVAAIIFGMVTIPFTIEDKTYCEATIIDNYPIGALYSKYEIVDKRGDLWVLSLRDSYVESEEVAGE